MTRRNDRLYLGQILDNARLGVRLRERTTKDIFKRDEISQHAFIHITQIIGEAARHVSPEGRSQFLDLPWDRIAGIKHPLLPEDGTVDLDRVWDTLVDDLPVVIRELLKVLPEDPPDDIDPSELA